MYPRTKKAYAEYEAAVKNFFFDEQIVTITTEGEPYVSSHGCDCCGSWEQQLVFDAKAIVKDKEGIEYKFSYQVCEDCQYYLEYGRLDDMQMDEIELSDDSESEDD